MSTTEARKEAYRRMFRRLKKRLIGDNDTAIVRLTASRAALDWIDVHFHDCLYYVSMNDPDIKTVDSLDKRRNRGARRLMRSLKTLADLQRTTVTEVQRRIRSYMFASVN
jgi:hypothetical protein